MSDTHEKMRLIQGLMEVGEALTNAIEEAVDWPDCPECGGMTTITDSDGNVLEAPNFFCESCEKVREINDGWD
jgi:hypothetical protein